MLYISGTYTDDTWKKDVVVTQTGSAIEVNYGGKILQGQLEGTSVDIHSFRSVGTVTSDGNIKFGDNGHWSLQSRETASTLSSAEDDTPRSRSPRRATGAGAPAAASNFTNAPDAPPGFAQQRGFVAGPSSNIISTFPPQQAQQLAQARQAQLVAQVQPSGHGVAAGGPGFLAGPSSSVGAPAGSTGLGSAGTTGQRPRLRIVSMNLQAEPYLKERTPSWGQVFWRSQSWKSAGKWVDDHSELHENTGVHVFNTQEVAKNNQGKVDDTMTQVFGNPVRSAGLPQPRWQSAQRHWIKEDKHEHERGEKGESKDIETDVVSVCDTFGREAPLEFVGFELIKFDSIKQDNPWRSAVVTCLQVRAAPHVKIIIVNMHLRWSAGYDHIRVQQMRLIWKALPKLMRNKFNFPSDISLDGHGNSSNGGANVIIVGDMNTHEGSGVFKFLKDKGLRDTAVLRRTFRKSGELCKADKWGHVADDKHQHFHYCAYPFDHIYYKGPNLALAAGDNAQGLVGNLSVTEYMEAKQRNGAISEGEKNSVLGAGKTRHRYPSDHIGLYANFEITGVPLSDYGMRPGQL